MRIPLLIATTIAAACSAISIFAANEAPAPEISVNDLMITVVAPATNTLWGIDDPQSDADWAVFIEAADRVIEAGNTIKRGGAGPSDNEWAESPDWQAFADRLIGAGIDARTAAENQSIEAMWTAGEVLYPPCEECHLQFHPGVRDAQ